MVLYVEDDPDDIFFFQRALAQDGVNCQVQTVSSIPAAKSYLSGLPPYNDRSRFPLPTLIVTDMTIPGPEGSSLDLVEWVRGIPDLAELPIICASGNDYPGMVEEFAKRHIACHSKTGDMRAIADVVKAALHH